MKYYIIDYYSRGMYKYKIIKANSYEQAIKRARLKDIEEIREIDKKNVIEYANSIMRKSEVK